MVALLGVQDRRKREDDVVRTGLVESSGKCRHIQEALVEDPEAFVVRHPHRHLEALKPLPRVDAHSHADRIAASDLVNRCGA